MVKSRNQQLQQQVEQELKKKFEELTSSLADKEEQLSRALRKKDMRSLMHMETLAELSNTEEALNQSKMKCAALEESVRRLQEDDENHQRELCEKEESMKKMMEMEQDRELDKVKKMFEEDLKTKEEKMREQLFHMEENLQGELYELKEKYDQKILEKEDWMRQQLLEKEAGFKKRLAELCQPVEAKAQKWVLKIKDLEDQYQESELMRKEQEERTGMEIQRLSEELSHLQVRKTLQPLFLLQPNLKHDFTSQQLQAERNKKKKGGWRWKFWKKRK